jgi:hypothetical protein
VYPYREWLLPLLSSGTTPLIAYVVLRITCVQLKKRTEILETLHEWESNEHEHTHTNGTFGNTTIGEARENNL